MEITEEALEEAELSEELTDALTDALGRRWDSRADDAIEVAVNLLMGEAGDLGIEEVLEIAEALEEMLGTGYASGVEEQVREAVEAAYELGRLPGDSGAGAPPRPPGRVAAAPGAEGSQARVGVAFGRTDRRALSWLKKHHMYWVREHYSRQVAGQIEEIGRAAIEGGLSRRDAGQLFQEELSERFGQSRRYWEGMANQVTTRSREFGRVERFVEAGAEAVRVSAVLDRRTSCVCRALDGTVFGIADLTRQRDALMATGEPEAVKEVSPWLPCAEIQAASTAELVAKGVVMPPYHWHCRSMLLVAGRTATV